jgi:protein-L-isoaspartate(D-aspartate) O-methyltransferase
VRVLCTLVFLLACGSRDPAVEVAEVARADSHQLVRLIRANGVDDERVLAAIARVPRERFVLGEWMQLAYADQPLPIGHEVTISQPTVVAWMTQLAEIEPGDRVLEVGTGSGYQAAVLAELGAEVYTIERIAALATRSELLLRELGYTTIHVRHGDGFVGWPEHAPYDAILVTAAPATVPTALTDQLRRGAKLVAPVGAEPGNQTLVVVERTRSGLRERRVGGVAFVPMLPGVTAD